MIYVKQITGTHFPTFKGRLAVNGTHNGQPLYQRGMSAKWVWFDTVTGGYVISNVVGARGDYAWDAVVPTTNPDGTYAATGSHCEGAPVIGPITTPGAHGLIAIWSGSIASIPTGWVLCDGNHGTPDLRDVWLVGAGGAHNPGDSVGSATHTHTVSVAITGANKPGVVFTDNTPTGDFQPSITGSASGTTAAGSSSPPSKAYCFIMHL